MSPASGTGRSFSALTHSTLSRSSVHTTATCADHPTARLEGLALDPPRDDKAGRRRSVAAGMLDPNVAHTRGHGRVDLFGVVAEPATHLMQYRMGVRKSAAYLGSAAPAQDLAGAPAVGRTSAR